jgi:hypothetical protein
MEFERWHDWAMGNHAESPRDETATWQRVAEHAAHDACYDDASCGEDFRQRLGERFGNKGPTGFDQDMFERVCREKDTNQDPKFQLQGKTVDGTPPPFLSRVVQAERFTDHLNEAAGDLFPINQKEDLEEALEDTNDWTSLESFPSSILSKIGAYLAHPKSVRVFSIVGASYEDQNDGDEGGELVQNTTDRMQQDDSPPSASYEPPFWQWLDRQSASYSLTRANLALQALALGRTSAAPREYIYFHYRRESVGECRYPTPPDAEFSAEFRPVDPGNQPFGLTHPVIDGNHAQDLAVWEVVHENVSMPLDHIWVRTLQ